MVVKLDKEAVLKRLHAISRGEGPPVPKLIEDIEEGKLDFKYGVSHR